MDPAENAAEALVGEEDEPDVDPIDDIIDYLVRYVRGAFPVARVGEAESTTANTVVARNLYQRSVSDFLTRFGKHLALGHLEHFEQAAPPGERDTIRTHIEQLKYYHSPEGKHKRVKNRRYRALQQLRDESHYFSEKEMMFRNPLLYEQLVGQFLTDDEIAQRDNVDSDGLTFVNMILDTVDRNRMRQMKNEQELMEKMETTAVLEESSKSNKREIDSSTMHWGEFDRSSSNCNSRAQFAKYEDSDCTTASSSHWGDFVKPDTTPSFEPDVRKQSAISAPERDLLRREFLYEMYGSFLEGRDEDFDYATVDDNEQYDDLQIVDRDKEEEYFDSEPIENDNLEQSMRLNQEYGRKPSVGDREDELDVFMERLNKRYHLND